MNTDVIQVVTHRGLEPSRQPFYSESSYEAFASQLDRNFGLEFDFNLTADSKVVLLHDQNLSRLSAGTDTRRVDEVTGSELQKFSFAHGSVCFFDKLAPLLVRSSADYHAFHIKGNRQAKEQLDRVLQVFEKYSELCAKLILFDLKPKAARYLKAHNPRLLMAASVAHEYDIFRFNRAVHATLLSVSEVLKLTGLFQWVWLDEWDLSGPNDTTKNLYSRQTFKLLRAHNFRIGLVTPELHGTSPGLLGSEKHPDSQNQRRLWTRIEKIIRLKPDLICTDFPEEVKKIITTP